jgi:hypothetical protein
VPANASVLAGFLGEAQELRIEGESPYFRRERVLRAAYTGHLQVYRDKVLRLLVPLVVDIFTHSIWQLYLENITQGRFSGTFFEFLPHYFDGLYGFGGNLAWMGVHLWYLEMLFVYCLALLPLFRWLLKWLIIASTSFVTITALYEFVVRRANGLRFLFGMKPSPRLVSVAGRAEVPRTVQG